MEGRSSGSSAAPLADFGLGELALCFRLHANLARASVLLRIDGERAGWFLAVARAALIEPDAPLPADVLLELRRLVGAASASLREGDVARAESSIALAEGLCVVRMLRRLTATERGAAG